MYGLWTYSVSCVSVATCHLEAPLPLSFFISPSYIFSCLLFAEYFIRMMYVLRVRVK